MTAELVIETLRRLLEHIPPELAKDAIDLLAGRHPNPVAEFEARRSALYAGLQADADRRWAKP